MTENWMCQHICTDIKKKLSGSWESSKFPFYILLFCIVTFKNFFFQMVNFQILSSQRLVHFFILQVSTNARDFKKKILKILLPQCFYNLSMLLCFSYDIQALFSKAFSLIPSYHYKILHIRRYPYLSTCWPLLKCDLISLSAIKTGSSESFSMFFIALFFSLVSFFTLGKFFLIRFK